MTWTRVEDGLPETDRDVLVHWDKGGRVCVIAHVRDGLWYEHIELDWLPWVTHRQPLPPPPVDE